MGGLPALTRMTRLLYEKHVPADELLAPVFAGMPPGEPVRLAAWLAEVFGGPAYRSAAAGDGAPAGTVAPARTAPRARAACLAATRW
jgi:truncated hemoglobin YjbI